MSNFKGFPKPQQNWFQVPNIFWNLNLNPHQRVIMLYILRHTWGFQEFDTPKRITLDEFENGRKLKNGERMDNGVSMSRPTVVKHLNELAKMGYLVITVDDTDKARIEKTYMLKMQDDDRGLNLNPGGLELNSSGLDLNHRGKESLHRSEKDTIERNHRNTPPEIVRISLPDDITWSNHQWEDYRDLLTEHPTHVMQEAIDYIQRNGDTLTPQRISHIIRGKAAPAATGDADLPTMTDAILTGMGCTGAVTDATRKEARESARQLMGVGFTNAEASEYVTWVLRKAKAEGWKASIRSLVTNGRPNEWRNRNDAQAAQEPRPELPQYDPSAMLEAGLIGDGNE